jgi:hypothetical protein
MFDSTIPSCYKIEVAFGNGRCRLVEYQLLGPKYVDDVVLDAIL